MRKSCSSADWSWSTRSRLLCANQPTSAPIDVYVTRRIGVLTVKSSASGKRGLTTIPRAYREVAPTPAAAPQYGPAASAIIATGK